ncbi:hypothetical protein FO519_008821 [Halicephalobus sp. NKZ332]|nr:hypothetical protein FO519_008821 [Halicephalobus sp. NKZ332]
MNYTDDEISDVLNEMGFAVPGQDVLDQIKDGLLSFEGDIDNFIFEQFPNDLEEIFSHVDNDKITEPGVSKKYTDLLNNAYERARILYDEIDDIDKQIEAELTEMPFNLLSKLTAENMDEGEKREKQLRIKTQVPKQKDSPKLPDFEFDDENRPILLDERVEKELIDEVLRQRGITRVHCPAPGKAPFKHDPVARNQQYQEAWSRFPVPGAKRRKQLRWKIRELMLRRDVPVLRLVPNPGLVPRPQWVD